MANARRLALSVSLLSLILFGAPTSASAHGGYHHAVQESAREWNGGWIRYEVTNAYVPSSTSDHFVAPVWILQPDTVTPCGGGNLPRWLEVGWGEWGSLQVGGNQGRYRYFFNGITCQYSRHTSFSMAEGETVEAVMVPQATCSSGTGTCIWNAWFLRGGTWYLEGSATTGFGNDALVTTGIEAQSIASGQHWEVATAASNFDVRFYDAALRTMEYGGTLNRWTITFEPGTVLSIAAGAPYSLSYYALYYNFLGYRTD